MSTEGREGFTLIELLIVVVIIGILAAIAIPKFSSARDKGYRAAMVSDLKNLAHLQEVYHNDNYSYASTLTAVEATISDGVTIVISEATGTGWAATAVHQGVSAEQCGVYHGNADPTGGDPATTVGVVECTF
jgi:prepilin-type N-terminal cleavage/methylation domain-containing protein